jgi:hypothetical protein
MGTVHDIIEARGKRNALLETDLDRSVVEAAARYMADEDNGIGFLYSGWCQAALPHKRLPDGAHWQIKTERVTLAVEPGLQPGPTGDLIASGVPFGSRARLIFLYLQSTALKTNNREVELGRSLREWLDRMGIPWGGKSKRDVCEQAERISRCRFTFHFPMSGTRTGLVNQNVVDAAMFAPSGEEFTGQGNLFVEVAQLSEVFFNLLKKHPVPVEDAAIRAINNNSAALDLYAFLAYRLHSLSKPTPISWAALKAQFGTGVGRMDNFKTRFVDSLKLTLAVYREAKVEVEDRGLILYPSPPPVQARERAALR